MTLVAILDYGMGNLRSVGKALEHVGAEPFLTSDHARVREAGAVVLPGVGAMPKAMERVRGLALDQILRERVEASVPRRSRGDRPAARAGRGARRPRPEGAADRLEPGQLEARQPAERGPAVAVRLLPRELVRPAAG